MLQRMTLFAALFGALTLSTMLGWKASLVCYDLFSAENPRKVTLEHMDDVPCAIGVWCWHLFAHACAQCGGITSRPII